MNTTKWLGVMVVLQVLTLLGVWAGNHAPDVLPQAQAQALDSGSQRQQIISELKDTNTKLDRLLNLLENGKLQVQVNQPDEKDSRPARSR